MIFHFFLISLVSFTFAYGMEDNSVNKKKERKHVHWQTPPTPEESAHSSLVIMLDPTKKFIEESKKRAQYLWIEKKLSKKVKKLQKYEQDYSLKETIITNIETNLLPAAFNIKKIESINKLGEMRKLIVPVIIQVEQLEDITQVLNILVAPDLEKFTENIKRFQNQLKKDGIEDPYQILKLKKENRNKIDLTKIINNARLLHPDEKTTPPKECLSFFNATLFLTCPYKRDLYDTICDRNEQELWIKETDEMASMLKTLSESVFSIKTYLNLAISTADQQISLLNNQRKQ